MFVQASWVYHSSGEDQTHWSLSLDQTLAYLTFAHTILCTAPRLQLTSVPGLCGLIVAALLVYSIAVPLRGHHNGALCLVRLMLVSSILPMEIPYGTSFSLVLLCTDPTAGYSFWHTSWHIFVYLGQAYICAELPALSHAAHPTSDVPFARADRGHTGPCHMPTPSITRHL